MKITKREENWIIIHFMFYFVLFIIIVVFIISSILPKITEIENDKAITKDTYENIQRIEKNGLSFDEFKKVTAWINHTRVITEIVKNMTEDFYTKNLVNNTTFPYNEFLNAKNIELNSDENKALVDEKSKQIASLLPSYSEDSISLWADSLTDYKFINYIESLIESFNFATTNPIGISKLVLLDDFSTSINWNDALDSNIYYIPLNIVLKWTKEWVINFLYFIENVWNITVNNKEITLNKNYSFLSKNGIRKVLEWDTYSSNYNIFEHQIADIDKISMNDYIDWSYVSKWDTNLKDFILKTQWNDEFEISVNLMFYVKWQPTYKIEEFIINVLNKHKDSQNLVNKALANPDLNWIDRKNLTIDNDLLKQYTKEIATMRKELSKKDKYEELYKKAIKIDSIIEKLFKKLQK